MTSAGHLIRCVHSFAVGVEQQLCHIERRALGGGVVKRQLFVLHAYEARGAVNCRAVVVCERRNMYGSSRGRALQHVREGRGSRAAARLV